MSSSATSVDTQSLSNASPQPKLEKTSSSSTSSSSTSSSAAKKQQTKDKLKKTMMQHYDHLQDVIFNHQRIVRNVLIPTFSMFFDRGDDDGRPRGTRRHLMQANSYPSSHDIQFHRHQRSMYYDMPRIVGAMQDYSQSITLHIADAVERNSHSSSSDGGNAVNDDEEKTTTAIHSSSSSSSSSSSVHTTRIADMTGMVVRIDDVVSQLESRLSTLQLDLLDETVPTGTGIGGGGGDNDDAEELP